MNTQNNINLKNVSIKFIINTLSEFSFTNISDLEDAIHESLPVYLSPYVYFPTVIIPILVFCIVFIILYCCVKRQRQGDIIGIYTFGTRFSLSMYAFHNSQSNTMPCGTPGARNITRLFSDGAVMDDPHL